MKIHSAIVTLPGLLTRRADIAQSLPIQREDRKAAGLWVMGWGRHSSSLSPGKARACWPEAFEKNVVVVFSGVIIIN